MTGKPLNSILVKPAGPDCNLDCAYCFYSGKSSLFPGSKSHRMTDDILMEMIRQIMAQADDKVGIAWQGGEPTLMGLGFFQKAVDLMTRFGRNHNVGNGLQTNGLLIDKDWARFLRQYNFLVGLSIDGPEHIHDHYRRRKDGSGTWSMVCERAKLMLDQGVSVNAVGVVTDYGAEFPDEIYGFYKGIGLNYMQLIPCVETDHRNPESLLSFSVSAERYGPFLCRLFDLWLADFVDGCQTTSIRFFDSILHSYVGLTPPECTLLKECGNYLVIEHNGDVYSCDFFVEPRWRVGNIKDGLLLDMLNSKKQKAFGSMKKNLPEECIECRWINHCHGGCIKDRARDKEGYSMNYLCKAYKMFFQHADVRLQALATEWKNRQKPARPLASGRPV
ncbi:MAG: anaerobic sulfatase maturase [Deltaproteobacteria bacterium]|nr:anaerobic sulfatase maturase [Deltaproteobacteria bacterium]